MNFCEPTSRGSTPRRISLSWTTPSGFPDGYTLYLGTDGGGVITPISDINGADLGNVLSTLLPVLLPNTTYYYQLVPLKPSENGLSK